MSSALGDDAFVLERTVRKTLDEYANLIETRRGAGYRLHERRKISED